MKRIRRTTWALVAFMAIALCTAGTVRAAVDKLVPADSLVVVKVHEPYTQMEKLTESELFARLTDPGVMPDLANGVRQVKAMVDFVEQQHKVNVERVLSGLFAGEMAVAINGEGSGVMLIEGENHSAVQKGLSEFLRVRKDQGELTGVKEETYKGVKVRSSQAVSGQEDRVYAVLGKVLVVANPPNRGSLRHVIDISQGQASSLAATPRYRKALSMVSKGSVISGYVDVPGVLEMIEKTQPHASEDPVARFIGEWLHDNVSFASMSVTAKDALQGSMTVKYAGDRLPEYLASLLPEQGNDLEILNLIPRSAALAGARSTNLKAVYEGLHELAQRAPGKGAQQMEQGLQFMVGMIGGIQSSEQLFDELGDEMALFVLPSGHRDHPPAVGFMLQLRNKAHIPLAIETLVGTAVAGARGEGKIDIRIKAEKYHDVPLTVVRSDEVHPPVLRKLSPTLCVVGDYLTITSTVDAAKQVIDAPHSRAAYRPRAAGTVYRAGRVDLKQVRRMFQRHRDFLTAHAVLQGGRTTEQAQADLKRIDKILSFMDEFTVTESHRRGVTTHVMTLKFSEAGR